MIYDVVIIGAGVTGGMLARELSKYDLRVLITEKNNDVAMGASKANSGIVHGGYDPEPDTLKAKLNSIGVEKLFDTAKMLNVPIKRNGSLVCAFSEDENSVIDKLYERGVKNGIIGLEILNSEEVKNLEPMLSDDVTRALLVKNAGIVCPYELTVAAIGNAMDNGVELKRNFEVSAITRNDNIIEITSTTGETVKSCFVVNCAGVYADKVAEAAGDTSFKIIPRAGEYLLLDKKEGTRVTHTIFQVPTKQGKGILVTPTVDGNLLIGPTADVVESKDNTETTEKAISTVIKLAKKSVSDINIRQVITSFSGVRASGGKGDFIIEPCETLEGMINVAAIDSPGLSSCVSIAEYTVELLKEIGLSLTENKSFNGKRENPHFFREMNEEEKDDFIKNNPDYGHIVCRCETVSEGEIRAAIKRNPPAYDVDGVKRRTRAGMGRCQGGFCMPYVIRLISEEHGIDVTEVTKKGGESKLVIGRI